jgi:hypothetical protein
MGTQTANLLVSPPARTHFQCVYLMCGLIEYYWKLVATQGSDLGPGTPVTSGAADLAVQTNYGRVATTDHDCLSGAYLLHAASSSR